MLREDNADMRLTEIGRRLGLVDDVRWDAFNRKRDAVAREVQRLQSTRIQPRQLVESEALRVFGQTLEREYTLADLLRRPGVSYQSLMSLSGAAASANPEPINAIAAPQQGHAINVASTDIEATADIELQIETQLKYDGYIARQRAEVQRNLGQESTRLSPTLDYADVRGLSIEVRQKLNAARPETIGQASRISGVTPAAVSLLLVHLKKQNKLAAANSAGEPRQFAEIGADGAAESESASPGNP
jgi:tRNA uridine 5-carboxymethylaminomethyl modification enzyme